MATSINIKIYGRGATPGTDTPLLDVFVDDNSYRSREIMGDDSLTLYYSLPEHVELPVGAFCEFQGETYTLMSAEALKMQHSRNFEYTVTMESSQAKAKLWKFRNPVDGRLSFSLTAKPQEHLQMFVDNMNRRDSGWTVGSYISSAEKVITYDHSTCMEALQAMASEFDTEWEIVGKTVSLRKVEYNKNNPLALAYGKGNGFKPGVGRSNYSDTPAVEILLPQGGSRNIDTSKYGSPELLLPKSQTIGYDGTYFEDENGYDSSNARTYITEGDGRSLYRVGRTFETYAEESLDCSDIYPSRIGTVTDVAVVNEDENLYDIYDTTIPEGLDFSSSVIGDETLTIIFQSGQLAGREFEVAYYHDERRFEIVPATIDTFPMPSATYAPAVGDTYAIFNCLLPDAYFCDNDTKSGASWDMFRAAVRYLYDNEDQLFSFTGELDGIWAKKNWTDVGGKIKLGGFVSFMDIRFQAEPVLVRIIRIKDYINDPHSPTIELSNATVTGGFATTLKQLESTEVVIENRHKDAILFTKRRFRDALETMDMLSAAISGYTDGISPIAVHTMQMLVGDESLQFRFVDNMTSPTAVAYNVTYDSETKVLTAPAGIIQHMSLGISSLSSTHDVSEYKFWSMDEYNSTALSDASKRYYLYAKVSKTITTGQKFTLSEDAIALEGVSGYYHLLVGILGTEVDGVRSYVSLYGFTEILPGRVTTDKVVSAEGTSYFDLASNAMALGDALTYNTNGDGKLRIKGTIVQSSSGDENVIGVFRGVYRSYYTYYQGDEVTFTLNGVTSTYRCTSSTAIKGISPSNTTYWAVIASGGEKGDQGDQGEKGDQGAAGNYTELRYAVNGSKSTAPTLSTSTRSPSGWSTSQPEVGELQYLWMTSATINGGTEALETSWTTPIRITPYDGIDGTAQKGERGVSPTFQGTYSASKTYIGNSLRADVVYYNSEYWMASTDAGSFSGQTPSSSSTYWNDFGASFESIATGLLLAEWASIAGFVFKNNKMWSQYGYANGSWTSDPSKTGFVPNLQLDGVQGIITTGEGVQLTKNGLEIDTGDSLTSVQNHTIAEMIELYEGQDDTGTITIPTTATTSYATGLDSGESYTLIVDTTLSWTHDGNETVTGRSSSAFDMEIYYQVRLKVRTSSGTVAQNYLLIDQRDTVCTIIDDDRSDLGYVRTIYTSGSAKLSANQSFTIPSNGDAVLEVTKGVSVNGTCTSYSCNTGTYTIANPAEWYLNDRQWTFVGNDGIYITKNGASVKITNSDGALSFIVKGLPGSSTSNRGELYVDSDGSIKVS